MTLTAKEIDEARQRFIAKRYLYPNRDSETRMIDEAWIDALGFVLGIPPKGDS